MVPEKTIVPLKKEVSFEQGALIEPIAVGMHAVRQNRISISDTVLIIGAGTIGLGILLSVRACNPRCIIMTDVWILIWRQRARWAAPMLSTAQKRAWKKK